MKRVDSLDYLRGLMAFSVMLYHYFSWSFDTLGGEYLLGKLGIYAVSTFYVLSGISLAIIYKNKFSKSQDLLSYGIKRVFRIFPLFWLAVTSMVLLKLIGNEINPTGYSVDVLTLFLNYSLLFGFVDPSAYLTTGAWSIGNELVFYAFFPIFVILARFSRLAFFSAVFLTAIIYFYYAFFILHDSQTLSAQWEHYINPFNQLFLFAAGVSIGLYVKPRFFFNKRYLLFILLALSLLVIYYPSSGDKVEIVTGWARVYFTVLCLLFCYVFYASNFILPGFLGASLKFLGETSYSIYLLHPIIAKPVILIATKLGVPPLYSYLFICIPITLIISWFVYRLLEKPMMAKGAKLSKKATLSSYNESFIKD